METKNKKNQKSKSAVVSPTSQLTTSITQVIPGVMGLAKLDSAVEQATLLVDLAHDHQDVLAEYDWSPGATIAFESNLTKMQAERGEYVANRIAGKEATVEFHVLMSEAIVFRDQLVSGLRVVELKHPEALADVSLGLTGTTKPANLLSWFTSAATVVSQYESELIVQGTPDPVNALAMQIETLNQALGARAKRLVRRGQLASSLKEARIDLATSMVTLRRIAASAFAGNAAVLKEFNQRFAKVKRTTKAVAPVPNMKGASA